ncbi:MAG: hypothetical protein U1F43_12480 [Myxococcota bacterium]
MRGHLILVACAAMACLACSVPDGDQTTPSGTHYLWLAARAEGGVDRLWELLDPSVKAEFERWHQAEGELVKMLRTEYPKEDAVKALNAIGGPFRGDAADGKALFKLFMRPAPDALGMMGAAAAHVRSEEIAADGKTATIRTFGGDEVVFVKGADGKWYTTMPSDDLERLRNARSLAEQNLARVKSNLKKLGRPGQ